MGVPDDEAGVGLQFMVWGWAISRGAGTYPTVRDRYYAELEVAAVEGVDVHGRYDADLVELWRNQRLTVNGRGDQIPYSWALAGYLDWHSKTGRT